MFTNAMIKEVGIKSQRIQQDLVPETIKKLDLSHRRDRVQNQVRSHPLGQVRNRRPVRVHSPVHDPRRNRLVSSPQARDLRPSHLLGQVHNLVDSHRTLTVPTRTANVGNRITSVNSSSARSLPTGRHQRHHADQHLLEVEAVAAEDKLESRSICFGFFYSV